MREAMKQALEGLEYIYEGANKQGPHTGISWRDVSNKAEPIITALRQALANEALDRMAENARELGLDYDPAGGTQVSKVWWDGDKLMAKSIPLSEVYKEPEHQPADEPVAWIDKYYTSDLYKNKPDLDVVPLYTRPQPAAQWVGLTDEEIEDACWTEVDRRLTSFARDKIGRAHV